MNTDAIVKALKCCIIPNGRACQECPYHEVGTGCRTQRNKDAVEIILQLIEENRHLQDLLNETQQYNEAWVEDNGKLRTKIKTIKSDIVQKMTDMLKKRLPVISPSVFNQIAKTVLEESDEQM